MTITDNHSLLLDWLRASYKDRLRPAGAGAIHPYVDPGAAYTGVLWDWDAFFSCVGFAALAGEDPAIGLHARGCIDNFIAYQGADGSIPYAIMIDNSTGPNPNRRREADSPRNNCKPLLAQFALLTHKELGAHDDAWLASIFPALERYVDHWFDTQNTAFGLLTWRSHRGSGADNNPAYFQRPHNSVADPYLNAMMVRECHSLATIAKRCGADFKKWQKKGEVLADAINTHLWDPIDQTYYCIDVSHGEAGRVNTERNWVVPLKFRTWTMVMPLWAGTASQKQAKAVIEKYIINPKQLRSPHGIYTLAPCEPAFQMFTNYNPSNWLGPVWVINTYLTYRALLNYNYTKAAEALAADHLACLAKDFQANGCLHEYYDPDTGVGLTHPGFVNWNSCACLMA